MLNRRSLIIGTAALMLLPKHALSSPTHRPIIYKWGSSFGGNDWCFVRLPANYRWAGPPHRLAVLNHGNGWIMDGTEAKANFSEKTQFGVDKQRNGIYLLSARPDYRKYSNPLIEHLLAMGFVVAGAQNDGQHYGHGSAGYGNLETAKNIASFTNHLKHRLNVEERVHFFAASNGAIGSLNALRFMPIGSVESMTLFYPLINLDYAAKVSHPSQVANAYHGKSMNGHDPLNDDFNAPLPPILCFYSSEDTVTPAKIHWLPFSEKLKKLGIESRGIQVTGQHGSWPHLDQTSAITSWLNQP
jgi:hypothetical protein